MTTTTTPTKVAPEAPLAVAAARAALLAKLQPLPSETVPVIAAAGRVLSAPVPSLRALPGFDNSAMDGYGVRSVDVMGASAASPVALSVRGASVAGGAVVSPLGPGCAVQIMTGARVPAGVDAIVMREVCDERDVKEGAGVVFVREAAPVGQHVRRRGEDVAEGAAVGAAGDVVTPARMNLLLSAGHTTVAVHRRPSVAILATGDELKEVGAPLTDDDVVNSNAWAVAAAVSACGCAVRVLPIAKDGLDATVAALRSADDDVLLTIGGVSMGARDFVRPALLAVGATLDAWRVAMKPGKPIAFARRALDDGRSQQVLALPGNPVSSLVTFQLFVQPALWALQGRRDVEPRLGRGIVEGPGQRKKPGLAVFARAVSRVDDDGVARVRFLDRQGSGQVSGLADANVLVVLDARGTGAVEGDAVPLLWL